MTPYEAKGTGQVCELQTDNHAIKDFWILTDGYHVSIHEQELGEKCKQGISVPRTTFNRLIDWYLKEQNKRSRHER